MAAVERTTFAAAHTTLGGSTDRLAWRAGRAKGGAPSRVADLAWRTAPPAADHAGTGHTVATLVAKPVLTDTTHPGRCCEIYADFSRAEDAALGFLVADL